MREQEQEQDRVPRYESRRIIDGTLHDSYPLTFLVKDFRSCKEVEVERMGQWHYRRM